MISPSHALRQGVVLFLQGVSLSCWRPFPFRGGSPAGKIFLRRNTSFPFDQSPPYLVFISRHGVSLLPVVENPFLTHSFKARPSAPFFSARVLLLRRALAMFAIRPPPSSPHPFSLLLLPFSSRSAAPLHFSRCPTPRFSNSSEYRELVFLLLENYFFG